MSKEELYPLQLILRNILLDFSSMNADPTGLTDEEFLALIRQNSLAETMKYALIFISSAPVLCIYPFIQKYFVKGVMIGAVKG